MRFSSANVMDAPRVRDQGFRCRCCSALKESLEQPSQSLAKRHINFDHIRCVRTLSAQSSEEMAESDFMASFHACKQCL